MKVISEYVREQRRYTKNDLRSIFSFDEAGIEKFIKNLKSYGVLKSVKNSADQLEMSDLIDDDVEIADEAAQSGECLYVFTYVGIIICGSRVVKVFPKYLLSGKDDVLAEMKQALKVLEKYSRSEKQIVNVFHGDGENRRFNLLAVILFLLNDYYEYGIYSNSEDVIEVNGEGEILWGRTIDEGFALIEGGRPYYMELYTAKSVEDNMDYFKRLHECVLTECSRQLWEAQIDMLFDMDRLQLSEETLESFGDREYVLWRIANELNLQFNTRRQILLKTLYAYISQNRKMLDGNDGLSMFGTTSYHAVWEKACAEVFDNKLGVPLGQLQMSVPLAGRYREMAEEKLLNIIKKPIWKGKDTAEVEADTLKPDLISMMCIDGNDWFIILDAKYYNLRLEEGKALRGNPGVGDVAKQYLYQLAYRDFIDEHQIPVVRNCFLMPTEGEEVVEKGVVKMGMFEPMGLEDIQIRLIPATKLYECYLSNVHMDVRELRLN